MGMRARAQLPDLNAAGAVLDAEASQAAVHVASAVAAEKASHRASSASEMNNALHATAPKNEKQRRYKCQCVSGRAYPSSPATRAYSTPSTSLV